LIPKTLDPKTVGDFQPISLIGCIYKVVTKILATRLSLVISDLVSNVQTAFLHNRQILDGPFIINELIARCHHKKQQAMIFKVDFAKAYDSVRWDYLDAILNSFGFGSKWRSWIRGSLHSSMALILVNGSPTFEFQFYRGLKQGDPLAPYLFILVMESLHLSFSRVVEEGTFTGIKIDSSITLSHLFYADDAIFIGKWSRGNLNCIAHMLRCFSLLSGLSINFQKSQLLGVGVPDSNVIGAASLIGCSILRTPFKYMGTVVGGGRLTLLKSVLGSTPIYNMSLYKVPKSVLNSMESLRRNFFNVAVKLSNDFVSSFRREVRGGVESEKLSQLLDFLGTVVLSPTEDRWIWDLNGSGLFVSGGTWIGILLTLMVHGFPGLILFGCLPI
nr:RNA-directed DNA polymerase, eukaryota [Tanacetum cinerariifolium]